MYEFSLPLDAIVEIQGNRYNHLGLGKFTGVSGTERPSLIEATSDLPTPENDTVLLVPYARDEKPRYRVIYLAGTEAELAELKAQT